MNEILNTLSNLITEVAIFSPLIALFAGILTAFLPCTLSMLPLIIGYVGTSASKEKKSNLIISIVFSIGFAITLTILGALTAILGNVIRITSNYIYLIFGILMILMALQTFEIITIIKPTNLQSKFKKKGYIGAFIAGVLTSLFSMPCSTPVLVVIFSLVATKAEIIYGIILLFMYSLGNSLIFILVGVSIGKIKSIISNNKYQKFSIVLKYLLGTLILILGLYMLYLGF